MTPRHIRGFLSWDRVALLISVSLGSVMGLYGAANSTPKINFEKEIRPIFVDRCQVCHGAQMQMNGLRLDRRDDALRGGYAGTVITPGNSVTSKLIHMVTGQIEDKIMPPAGKRLTEKEIDLLRTWIDQGAEWTQTASDKATTPHSLKSSHWAFNNSRNLQYPKFPIAFGCAMKWTNLFFPG